MKVRNLTRDCFLVTEGKIANGFFARLLGLMGRSALRQGDGLLIEPCNSIHMFFMRFPLDILFLDKNYAVVRVVESIRPWRATRIVFSAHSVLELPTGTIKATGTRAGDKLQISD